MNSKPQKSKGSNAPRKKVPKKITPTYLHNSGLYYLERFAASSGHFREVMLRKAKRSCMAHEDQNYDECVVMIDELVQKFITAGLLDDQTYTRGMVHSLRRRGKSQRYIQGYLRNKNLSSELIDQMLEHHEQENHENAGEAEFEAALTFARKKRLGPFSNKPEPDFEKDLAKLARAGFSYDTSRSVLNKGAVDPYDF